MQQILNDKFGLSYLSGNAQYLYANTATSQQFDTINANAFVSTSSNLFVINASGLYTTAVYAPTGNIFAGNILAPTGLLTAGNIFAPTGNISAANLVIIGNLYLQNAGAGSVGQYLVQTGSGIRWESAAFFGGDLSGFLTIANTTTATSITSGVFKVHGGSAFWGNIFANGNITATGANTFISSLNTVDGTVTNGNILNLVTTNFSSANIYQTGVSQSIQTANAQIGTNWGDTSRANLVVGNVITLHATSANITTLSAVNFSSSNIRITGGFIQTVANIQTANAQIGTNWGTTSRANLVVGNVITLHATSANITTLSAVNFSSSNIRITGGFIQTVANIQTANLYLPLSSTIDTVANVRFRLNGNLISNGNISANTLNYTAAVIEPVAIQAGTAVSGEININLKANSTHYFTTTTPGVWTPNVRASSGEPLNDMLAVGQSISFSMIVQQGAPAYTNNSGNLRIDNNWITAKWPNAVLPISTSNRTEIFSYTLIKTAASTWLVFGSLSSSG